MDSWDDDNFEPQVVMPITIASNKWEGEDEDEDVKDNWEDEDEEKKEEVPAPIQQKPKKKSIQEKIAEKERLRAEELARKRKEEEEDDEDDLPPEERLRRQKESDLNAALETTFGGSNTPTGIDGMDPKSKEEFQELADAIVNKVQPYTKSAEYPVFAETVVRNICATMSSLDIKKIKNTIDNLYMEKQKIEKGDKAKKSKTKGKAKLKMDNENQFSAYVEDYDEFDDFM
ncbi:eukaryotic translation initiation factor 3 subunit J [Onthophagus taurus]|uniref:eukaryotic translation initiation factor 3 subunit J n=1 Tax=Onthophagus taurus TaxID=166361 RepID=UPI000C20CC4F|nr:eukaryotic translation initiation factor 3 subunit J [Onthophagus taurus]